MQLTDSDAEKLTRQIIHELKTSADTNLDKSNIEIVISPSMISLKSVSTVIKEHQFDFPEKLSLGAQNVFYHEKGSYTGETSPLQLAEFNVKYVIIGHSERRKYIKESDEEMNLKTKACLTNNLIPIVCVGETFEERQSGKTDLVLIKQITAAMQDIDIGKDKKLVIAYEPVWVIGTGQAIKPEDAFHATQVIKQTLKEFFDQPQINDQIYTIYGGSVDAENINNFIKSELIDGALIGGASLSAEKFLPLIKAVIS